MSAEPVTAEQEDSAVTLDEEPSKDAPNPIEETLAQPTTVEAPFTPIEAPSTLMESPSTLQAPGRPAERRGSSVLARVRAMESPKPPGSFD